MTKYIEMTAEEAMKLCGKQAKVLVATSNLEEEEEIELIFIPKKREEYNKIFDDVKTIAGCKTCLKCFTETQDIYHILPRGRQKIVLLKE